MPREMPVLIVGFEKFLLGKLPRCEQLIREEIYAGQKGGEGCSAVLNVHVRICETIQCRQPANHDAWFLLDCDSTSHSHVNFLRKLEISVVNSFVNP
jgi:hypothetical protein